MVHFSCEVLANTHGSVAEGLPIKIPTKSILFREWVKGKMLPKTISIRLKPASFQKYLAEVYQVLGWRNEKTAQDKESGERRGRKKEQGSQLDLRHEGERQRNDGWMSLHIV
jgi:hypothetical protein